MSGKGRKFEFKDFCRQNKYLFFIIGIFIFLTYGFMLVNYSFSINTEAIVGNQSTFYDGWFGINRYGLVFTKWLFNILSIIPGYATILMILTTFAYSVLWLYLFQYLEDGEYQESKSGQWIFPVLFFTSVPVLELVNFQCLSFEVSFAMLLCAAALIFEWRWIKGQGGNLDLVVSIVLLVWCFASYQAFVPLYISASLACFILVYNKEKEMHWNDVRCMSIKLLAVFAASYFLYDIVGRAAMTAAEIDTGAYTDNMIQWGYMSVKNILLVLRDYFLDVVLARNIYWNYGYLIVIIGMVISIFWKCRKKISENRSYIFYSFVVLVFLGSPFLLPLLMGCAPAVRGQLSLPFVTAFGIWFLFRKFISFAEGYRSAVKYAAMAGLILIICNGCIVKDNRLLYTEYMVKEQERALTERLISRMENIGVTNNSDTTVVIQGNWSPVYNPSMLRGETLGWSFYEWNAHIDGTTERRVIDYWRVLGYRYNLPDIEQKQLGIKIAEDMPAWPTEGSIVYRDNIVVIKLSD